MGFLQGNKTVKPKEESLRILAEKLTAEELEILATAVSKMNTIEKTLALNYLKKK